MYEDQGISTGDIPDGNNLVIILYQQAIRIYDLCVSLSKNSKQNFPIGP
jgi:hypothetical protein